MQVSQKIQMERHMKKGITETQSKELNMAIITPPKVVRYYAISSNYA